LKRGIILRKLAKLKRQKAAEPVGA
jgi:hypothetical protein